MTRPVLVTAIMTCHNRQDFTLRCLESWFAQATDGVRLSAVLVDDGSDGTGELVARRWPSVEVVPGSGSLFWAAGMALAESHARLQAPDAIVWLNDDVVLDSDCLDVLRTVSASTEPAAVVAGATTDPVTGDPSYGAFASSRWHPLRGALVRPTGRPQPVRAVHGNILYVPRAAFEKAGIDGAYEHAYADFDFGMRLSRLGHPVLLSPAAVGTCSRGTTSRAHLPADLSVRERLRALNSPRGTPLRSHYRFLRRHGGPAWPALLVLPYGKEALRGLVRRRRLG